MGPSFQRFGNSSTNMMFWLDKVLNHEQTRERDYNAQNWIPVDLIAASIVKKNFKNGNKLLPIFNVDLEYIANLEILWRLSVVVKLLSRSISFKILYTKIEHICSLVGGFDALDLGHDYFLVKFDICDDFDKVMGGGSWACFPYVSVQYYDEDLLMALATGIGRPIKVDRNTNLANRGRFAKDNWRLMADHITLNMEGSIQFALDVDGMGTRITYVLLRWMLIKIVDSFSETNGEARNIVDKILLELHSSLVGGHTRMLRTCASGKWLNMCGRTMETGTP
ncbi:hypothetical protein K2173_028430 [Erythroxylum novogranatense]|uniref:DUF4283 domain-containing protein n=1 Tax=Erythroxylum novogranatense TaxID=1862640 RepID=A0AAV8U5W5_9ROSI|nr:hypothetical protein K2173_028430 [Erythroxylum novogranatense]